MFCHTKYCYGGKLYNVIGPAGSDQVTMDRPPGPRFDPSEYLKVAGGLYYWTMQTTNHSGGTTGSYYKLTKYKGRISIACPGIETYRTTGGAGLKGETDSRHED